VLTDTDLPRHGRSERSRGGIGSGAGREGRVGGHPRPERGAGSGTCVGNRCGRAHVQSPSKSATGPSSASAMSRPRRRSWRRSTRRSSDGRIRSSAARSCGAVLAGSLIRQHCGGIAMAGLTLQKDGEPFSLDTFVRRACATGLIGQRTIVEVNLVGSFNVVCRRFALPCSLDSAVLSPRTSLAAIRRRRSRLSPMRSTDRSTCCPAPSTRTAACSS